MDRKKMDGRTYKGKVSKGPNSVKNSCEFGKTINDSV